MHVESPLELSARRQRESQEAQESVRTQTVSQAGSPVSWGDDKELEEIFTRTYGISKREKYRDQGQGR